MARPREFDTNVAIARAMDVFWEHGYEEAKLPDLLEGMKLTRGSLYKAFTDKKTLFLQVLARYDEKAVSDAVQILTDPQDDGWTRIFNVFDSIEAAVRSGDYRGCLLCSAIAGPAAYDQEIENVATKSLERMLLGFEEALRNVVPETVAKHMAHTLVTQYIGMRVMARTDRSAYKIKNSIISLKKIAQLYEK